MSFGSPCSAPPSPVLLGHPSWSALLDHDIAKATETECESDTRFIFYQLFAAFRLHCRRQDLAYTPIGLTDIKSYKQIKRDGKPYRSLYYESESLPVGVPSGNNTVMILVSKERKECCFGSVYFNFKVLHDGMEKNLVTLKILRGVTQDKKMLRGSLRDGHTAR
ncbi:hypothetical protein [Absidia glauca]|uniref:Uncharacterized protein n=1 Tax=Absidia glauca TaxID=4829 RepID=A0A163LT58_ABSGL|nr:hypothetical protein [Absidia glauca]